VRMATMSDSLRVFWSVVNNVYFGALRLWRRTSLSLNVIQVTGCADEASCSSSELVKLCVGGCQQTRGARTSLVVRRGHGAGIGSWSSRSCSGVMSKDFWMPSLRVPRPSVVFLLHGASMRLLVSSIIDVGSRLR
jgi:hypothetical protein